MKKNTLINFGITIAIFVVIMPAFYASAFPDVTKVQSKTKVRKFLNVIGTIEQNRIEFETWEYEFLQATFYDVTEYKIDKGDVGTYLWRNTDRSYGLLEDPDSCYQYSWGEIYIVAAPSQYLDVTSIIEGLQNGGSSDDDILVKHGTTSGWWNLVTSTSTW